MAAALSGWLALLLAALCYGAAWYGPRQRATFVIAVTGRRTQDGMLTVPAATALFGRPAAAHPIGQDVILLYGYNLLTRLHGR